MAYELEDELELEDEFEDEGELEDEMEDEAGEGEGWLGAIGNVVGSLMGEGEDEDEGEFEDEFEDELEDEVSPTRKIYPDAMMEHLGELASEAETEDEAAEQFLPLIGMAASKLLPVVARAVAPAAKKLLPKIARAVTKAAPHLTKKIGTVARTLHRNPQTRHLLKVVPAIARRTVGSVARQAAHGRRITPHAAVRTLAKHARKVLTHPGQRKHALRHHRRLEHKFHRRFGRGTVHPHLRGAQGHRLHGRHAHAAHLHGRHLHGHLRGHGVRGAGHGVHAGAPGAVHRHGVRVGPGGVVHPGGAGGVRYGRVVGGRCTCGACPSCGAAGGGAPSYCRCCGQVLR
jgi:hypothetical protein